MAPTKADSIRERMDHAFGRQRIERSFENMVSADGRDLLDYLTDEARDELLRRCITSRKLQRRFAAESRAVYARRAS
jgi:peptide methionine sulfoxide reductase MsrB